jgi:serine/threonine-protein kinase
MKLCPRCREPYADDAGFCPIDGLELVRDADPFVGRTLAARYRMLRKLGAGGMAVVYLARHVMIERLSAIKVLRQDLGMNPAHRERFYREARAVNRINHPNIVEITDFGEDAGLVFLVMEYVEGESLQSALRRGRLGWRHAAEVGQQVASALARAHELGVVHRDLKPENILLVDGRHGEGPSVKLTDFGIAKVVDAPTITFNEQRLGTPGFLAPEYIEGEPAGPLCDLYALGVVMYEMLTGALPYETRSAAELLAATLRPERVKPSARVGDIPAALEELVMRMIAREPRDRPRDAFAVQDALAQVLLQPGPASSMPPVEDAAEGGLEPPPTVPSNAPESAPTPPSSQPSSELAAFASARDSAVEPLSTRETAARWQAMLADLWRRVEEARAGRGDRDRGVARGFELAEQARSLVASVERVKAAAVERQAQVDLLEAQGRAFRASLGHAIDTLSHDRSRERAQLDAIDTRSRSLSLAASLASADAGGRDALLWERAALEARAARARSVESDLGYQIDELQRQLDSRNETLDLDLAIASGQLEGALSALRRLTAELVRTVDEGTRVLPARKPV